MMRCAARMAIVAAAALMCGPADAQTFDMRWIGEAIDARKPEKPRKNSHFRPKKREKTRSEAPKKPEKPRIFERSDAPEEADSVPRGTCLPQVGAISHERLSAENAWEDAQRAWMNSVRWLYGERFMSISTASRVVRICNISASSQGAAGRMGEALRDAAGLEVGGSKWRCQIEAQPCMAPREAGGR
jgi:hypothetical protein